MSAHGTKGSKGAGMTWVGRAIRRLEDPALITGQGRFTADLPAVHWVRFVRSSVAAGKIKKIDAPNGTLVVTAADLKGVKKITPMLHKFNYKPVGQPVLAETQVRFVGEAIAAVVAASEEIAEDVADLVDVTIDETAPVVDARDAIKPGAPQIHREAPGNIILEAKFKSPDFDATWKSAAKIVKVDARSHRQNATPMEARASHAAYDAATGRVTLTCTTQMPHLMRTAIADVLGMRESDLRVIAPDVGGGFGQKMSLCAEYVVLVWLARKLKSSVAWTEDRRENLIASFHARDQYITLQGAFDNNAKLLALKADIVANIGAYSCFPTTAGMEPLMAMAEMPGPYDVQQYECLARGVLTNTCTMAAYRGVSRPIITFTLERLMDKAAAAFAIDPVDIRRRNLIDKFPYKSAMGLEYDEATYKETLEMAVKAIDVPAFRARQKVARANGQISRHRLCDLLRAHRLRQSGLRGTRHGNHARLGDRHSRRRSVRLCRGAHRLVAARPGPTHHAGADHSRRDRRNARYDQDRAWRHRHFSLWLGHFRQPLAGDLRRRHADRGAESARQADQDRQHHAGGRRWRYRTRRRRCQSGRHRPLGRRSRKWRARPTRRRTASRARSSRA